jgi:hypothetical protein
MNCPLVSRAACFKAWTHVHPAWLAVRAGADPNHCAARHAAYLQRVVDRAFPLRPVATMERHMMNYSTRSSGSGEVFGAKVLYAAMVVGAAVLLMGAIWTQAPQSAPKPASQQVVVTAPPSPNVSG